MRLSLVARTLGAMAGAMLFGAGCATTTPSIAQKDAQTPQERTQRDQLSDMGRQDGDAAREAARKPRSPRPVETHRRTGQGVVDQPVRR